MATSSTSASSPSLTLRGRGCVITGASRGLGRALAFALAARGARVLLIARDQAKLDETVEELVATGAEAFGIAVDVADKEGVYPVAGLAQEWLRGVDVVVNNAATLGLPDTPLMDTPCETLERTLAVNVVGPFRLAKALAMPMVLAEHGVVVNISSDAGVEAYPGWGAYGVSKAALLHLTRIWKEELRDTGVRMLSFDPGEMDTDMHAEAMPDADRSTLAKPEDVAERLADLIAAGETHARGAA